MASVPSRNNAVINFGKGLINVYMFKNLSSGNSLKSVMQSFYSASWETLVNGSQIENVLSCFVLPMNIPRTNDSVNPSSYSPTNFCCGSNSFPGVATERPLHHFITFKYGVINATRKYNNYLDYSPYTTARIYLPCVGTKEIDLSEWWGHGKTKIGIYYQVAVLSGDITCFLVYYDNETNLSGRNIVYSFDSNCAYHLPLSASDNTRQLSASFSALASGVQTVAGAVSENIPMAVSGAIGTVQNISGATAPLHHSVSGNIAGSRSWNNSFTAYLIIDYVDFDSSNYDASIYGKPCHKYVTLETLKTYGYTKVENVHLKNIPCQQDGINEIDMLLRNGVVL